jgi:hypothetical protein
VETIRKLLVENQSADEGRGKGGARLGRRSGGQRHRHFDGRTGFVGFDLQSSAELRQALSHAQNANAHDLLAMT